MLLIYKCHCKVIHRVWRNSTIFGGLFPATPLLSSLPITPVHTAEPSLRSWHVQFNKSTQEPKKQIPCPGSQALERWFQVLRTRSPLQRVCRYRNAPSPRCVCALTTQLDQSSHAQGWKRMMPLHKLQDYWLHSGQMSKENKKRQK